MNPNKELPEVVDTPSENEDAIPVTSQLCQWKQPRKHKERAMKIGEAPFRKYQFGKSSKQEVRSLVDFDPRPSEYRGNAKSLLPDLLGKVRGKGLCVSLLFDCDTRVHPATYEPIPIQEMMEKVDNLKWDLSLTDDAVQTIEIETRVQRSSPKWYEMRRFRLTSSVFGQIKQLKPHTAPNNLVLQILGVKKVPVITAMQWGIEHEDQAVQLYTEYQHRNGHGGLYVCSCGIYIYLQLIHSWVLLPIVTTPYGFLEVRCPYSKRHMTPVEACSCQGFFATLVDGQPRLRRTHMYYSQVQGQMAIGGRMWCDFVIFTEKGISVERIPFDFLYWEDLLPKLTLFWEQCLVIQPRHHLGLPIRDMRKDDI